MSSISDLSSRATTEYSDMRSGSGGGGGGGGGPSSPGGSMDASSSSSAMAMKRRGRPRKVDIVKRVGFE